MVQQERVLARIQQQGQDLGQRGMQHLQQQQQR
jgi:hypothetical protein